jgi:hypothetical protein
MAGMNCPLCGTPDAYQGLTSAECVKPGCANYSHALWVEWMGKQIAAVAQPTEEEIALYGQHGFTFDPGLPFILPKVH